MEPNESLSKTPKPASNESDDIPRGILTKVSYDLSSSGMMAGSGSYNSSELKWLRDGSVTLTKNFRGGGLNSRSIYRVTPEAAEAVRTFVTEQNLAALSKKDIKTPLVYDCFTSATISMTYDDSASGGRPYYMYNLYCGLAGATFGKIEEKLSALLDACKETGECTFSEVKEQQNQLMGLMGMNDQPGSGTNTTPPQTSAAPQPGCWTCSACGCSTNKGKFCTECGTKRA